MSSAGFSQTSVAFPVSNGRLQLPIRCTEAGARFVSIRSIHDSSLWERFIGASDNIEPKSVESLADNVQLGSSWVVRVIEINGNDAEDATSAKYFQFPRDPDLPGKIEVHAAQDFGYTNLSNKQIRDRVKTLNSLWGTHHASLWNGQHFAIYLALIILERDSQEYGLQQANALFEKLLQVLGSFRVKRHISCMIGMAVFGMATCGIGAFASWGIAGGSMVSDMMAHNRVAKSHAALREEFGILDEQY